MERNQIIMTYSRPPGADELTVMAGEALLALPQELAEYSETLSIRIEEFADDAVQQEFDLDDPYELLALYRSGSQIAPGVTRKSANDDDVLIIYRRPLLDAWCETNDDLANLLRQVMIEELGQYFDFSDDEIEEMSLRGL